MQIFFSIFWWIYFCMFFSGYPLICLAIFFLSKNKNLEPYIKQKVYPLLPVAYAFAATSFWILMMYTGRINFVIEKIASLAPSLLVILYSLSALLFWLPVFRKNITLSFLHSLTLFLLPPLNMLFTSLRHKIIHHDYIIALLRIYTAGFIIYIIAIIFLLLVRWIILRIFPYGQYQHKNEQRIL